MISRKKYVAPFLLFVWCCLLALPGIAGAHSVVSSSSPAADAVVDEPLPAVTLTFNTTVEHVGLKVANEAGEQQPLEAKAGGKTLTGTFDLPLAVNGTYTVTWNIIGADGHAIKGEYSFRLAIPEPTASPSPLPSSSASESEQPAETTVPTASPSPSGQTDEPTATGSDTAADGGAGEASDDEASKPAPDVSLWALGAAAIVLAAAVAVALFKKRK